MNGAVEFDKCEVCGNEGILTRTYFHYNLKCECHSPTHFELVRHCATCEPKEPRETRVLLLTETLELTPPGVK